MSIFFTVIILILLLILLITTHECGHFIFARLFGVKVLRFAIGFGRPLYKYIDKKGTEFVIGWCLIGGYVRMLDEREAPVAPTETHLAFNRFAVWKRCIILLGGPAANFVLAIILFWLLFMLGIGLNVPIIDNVIPNSIAAQAQLPPHTEITKVDQWETPDWQQVNAAFLMRIGEKNFLSLTLCHEQTTECKEYQLPLAAWSVNNLQNNILGSLGIVPLDPQRGPERTAKFNLLDAWQPAWNICLFYSYFNLIILGKLVTGKISISMLGGPILLYKSTEFALMASFKMVLNFVALLSLAVALLNLLPLPGLDGGHIILAFAEKILGPPLSIRLQVLFSRLGIIVLILFMIQITMNDLTRQFG